uniref:Uncharacterized protein n=1 Tax=Micrurus carvalhoi TaxID=3147026 RepID=A0A2H6N3F5_9SAUR
MEFRKLPANCINSALPTTLQIAIGAHVEIFLSVALSLPPLVFSLLICYRSILPAEKYPNSVYIPLFFSFEGFCRRNMQQHLQSVSEGEEGNFIWGYLKFPSTLMFHQSSGQWCFQHRDEANPSCLTEVTFQGYMIQLLGNESGKV